MLLWHSLLTPSNNLIRTYDRHGCCDHCDCDHYGHYDCDHCGYGLHCGHDNHGYGYDCCDDCCDVAYGDLRGDIPSCVVRLLSVQAHNLQPSYHDYRHDVEDTYGNHHDVRDDEQHLGVDDAPKLLNFHLPLHCP